MYPAGDAPPANFVWNFISKEKRGFQLVRRFCIFETMKPKKIFQWLVLVLLLAGLGFGLYYAWFAFPIISGYGAKNACSCAFIQGRSEQSINTEELGSFPLSLGTIQIDYSDSSVTGTVWGLAKRKAIYRSGLGCTLINEFSEAAVRSQKFSIPFSGNNYDTGWRASSAGDSQSLNVSDLGKAVSLAFQQEYQKKPLHTRAVLIVHKNRIIAERYAPGYDQNSMFLGWSIAKSITGALIGILVRQGKLDPAQPAPVQQWQGPNDSRKEILLEHLLQQTSGLNFREDYNSHSTATNMLFNKGDMAGYSASLPLKEKPGTTFYYSSGNSNILSGIIRNTTLPGEYHAFPYKELFHKIGMYHTLLETDASGTFVGSSYIHASARDYARFGCLYLNDGVWNGERILPEGWVKRSTTPPAVNRFKNYGYQIWLNGTDALDSSIKEFPQMPGDFYSADGYGGQRIFIIPSRQLVAVRMGLNKFDEQAFLQLLMKAVGN